MSWETAQVRQRVRRAAIVVGSVAVLTLSSMGLCQTRDIAVEGMQHERRVALVIGNSAYPLGRLKNSGNDARAVAEVLSEMGFEVRHYQDLTYRELRRVVVEFGTDLQNSGVGLFYYAGHGLQIGGRNYLVPVDAHIRSESEAEVESIDMATVLARMETARNRANVVILDACRDNPFARNFRSAATGLVAMDAPSGTLIAYATAPGKLAWDGDGPNSLYTSELVKTIRVPGLKIEDVFKRVRVVVQRETKGQQVPWESSSLVGDFIFALAGPPGGGSAPTTQGATAPPRETVRPVAVPTTPPPMASLPPATGVGILTIGSRVPGVEVYLGEERLGETKSGKLLVVHDLAPGIYRVTGRKGGHVPWEGTAVVSADRRSTVTIDLQPERTSRPESPPRAERPIYTLGEKWIRNDGTFEIVRITNDRYVFAAPDGREIYLTKDLVIAGVRRGGTERGFEPPPAMTWPLEVGKWGMGQGLWRDTQRVPSSLTWRVDAFEQVSVPAGFFGAFRISLTLVGTYSSNQTTTLRLWYAPDIRQFIKGETIGMPWIEGFQVIGVASPAQPQAAAARHRVTEE